LVLTIVLLARISLGSLRLVGTEGIARGVVVVVLHDKLLLELGAAATATADASDDAEREDEETSDNDQSDHPASEHTVSIVKHVV
ncbi:MAG: hypothetical protein ACK56F_15260, partial [bacterium]